MAASYSIDEQLENESWIKGILQHLINWDGIFLIEVLVRLKIEYNMDFCGDLANVQSIFNYANEYIRALSKIQFRGGK